MTEKLPQGFYSVRARYGFMQTPDVRELVRACCEGDIAANADDVTYYVGRTRLVPSTITPMMRWRKWLFSYMQRNASAAPDFFNIPHDRVVELGGRLPF